MAYLSSCPSYNDPALHRMSEEIGVWAAKNLEHAFDKREGGLHRGREARIALWMIVCLETVWDGARKCLGGLPQKTSFAASQDIPDQANFSLYACLVINTLTLFLTELEEGIVWPFYEAHGLSLPKNGSTKLVETVLLLLADLKVRTAPIAASPSTFGPEAYQPHVGRVLEALIPMLHARLVALDPAEVGAALEVGERVELGEKIGEWWERRVKADGKEALPIWNVNDIGMDDFPPYKPNRKFPFSRPLPAAQNKLRHLWDKYGRYPGKLGTANKTGIGMFFNSLGILGGGAHRSR